MRENAANCEQLKSDLERIQQRQRELDMQKGARPKERVVTGSRPESRMEVDEAPRSKGIFNLDRAAQEQMNEGLEVWISSESASSLRGLETQVICPLMDVALPGYTPSSTPGSSQVSGSSSRLEELHERLQLRSRESPARVDLPSTWGEQPVRNVVISSYKKNTEGRYHRHNRMDWSMVQRDRRDCFHDAAWVEYLTQPRVPEGVVHLIMGDSLLRVLTRIQSHWQTGILSFAGAATPQMLATLEMLGLARVYTVTLMVGTNDQGGSKEGDEAARQDELHSRGIADSNGSGHSHGVHHPLQHESGSTCSGDEHKSAKPERNNQADTQKKRPPRWAVGRGQANGAIHFPRRCILGWDSL